MNDSDEYITACISMLLDEPEIKAVLLEILACNDADRRTEIVYMLVSTVSEQYKEDFLSKKMNYILNNN